MHAPNDPLLRAAGGNSGAEGKNITDYVEIFRRQDGGSIVEERRDARHEDGPTYLIKKGDDRAIPLDDLLDSTSA